jgi:hypothetical protein
VNACMGGLVHHDRFLRGASRTRAAPCSNPSDYHRDLLALSISVYLAT